MKPGQASPQSPHPATRKLRSNGALCATSTQPRAKSSSPGSTAASRGAAASIQSLIPVRSAMPGGTGTPGLTSEANSPSRRPSRTRTAPISVIAAASGDHPVVSRSTTANSTRLSSTSASSPRPSAPAQSRPRPSGPGPSGPRRLSGRPSGSTRPSGSARACASRASDTAPHPLGAHAAAPGLITPTKVNPPTDISSPPRPTHLFRPAGHVHPTPHQRSASLCYQGADERRGRVIRINVCRNLPYRGCRTTGSRPVRWLPAGPLAPGRSAGSRPVRWLQAGLPARSCLRPRPPPPLLSRMPREPREPAPHPRTAVLPADVTTTMEHRGCPSGINAPSWP